MPKKLKLHYPEHTPNSIQDITKDFMFEYFALNMKDKKLSSADRDAFVEEISTTIQAAKDEGKKVPEMSAFRKYRRWFCEKYYPHLVIKQKTTKPKETFIDKLNRL